MGIRTPTASKIASEMRRERLEKISIFTGSILSSPRRFSCAVGRQSYNATDCAGIPIRDYAPVCQALPSKEGTFVSQLETLAATDVQVKDALHDNAVSGFGSSQSEAVDGRSYDPLDLRIFV